jgi:hypothetical protein
MGNNVEFVFVLLLFLNGKETKEFIKEHAFANHAVKIKIFVKFVL